jgi:hypothetical protein
MTIYYPIGLRLLLLPSAGPLLLLLCLCLLHLGMVQRILQGLCTPGECRVVKGGEE